jgi:hypothetical protein
VRALKMALMSALKFLAEKFLVVERMALENHYKSPVADFGLEIFMATTFHIRGEIIHIYIHISFDTQSVKLGQKS